MRHAIRRSIAMLTLMVGMFTLPFVAVSAQEASPTASASLLAGLGLPVLEISITGEGITAPAEIAAGPVLLTGTNQADGLLIIDVAQIPEGVTVEDYLAVSAVDEPTIPDWAADLVLAGALELAPGSSGSIVVNLAPGEWLLVAGGETTVATPSVSLTVTGEAQTETSIEAALDISLGEYVFDFPDTVATGPQIWHATNTHTVLHHAVVFPVDRLYTPDEVMNGLMASFSGTPVADSFTFETSIVGPPTGIPVISAGQEVWVEANLQPGFYVAVCFISDPGGDGTPHAMMGMIDTFEATAP